MRVAVVGGKLQGIETCYLAHRAGWEVVLIDRDPSAPASGLCGTFVTGDILKEPKKLAGVIRHVDLIIPALEDLESLRCLAKVSTENRIPLALDLRAYDTTASKKASDHLFRRLGLSTPQPWPDCGLPAIVKPVGSSGSQGVRRIADPEAFDIFRRGNKPNLAEWVIQEYLEGPSYSLEVIGLRGRCISLQPTLLEMDATFDCKRVVAPADLSTALDQEFKTIGSTLAQTLDLNGVMDLEVILHEGRLKILEIDARLPSQTPTAVEKSTGINILELLREIFVETRLPEVSLAEPPRGVVYEHIRVQEDRVVEVLGEHIMAQAGPLHMEHDFFGADTALTNFSVPDRPWVATLVMSAPNREQAWEKRDEVIHAIMETCNLSYSMDQGPDKGHSLRGRRGDPSRT